MIYIFGPHDKPRTTHPRLPIYNVTSRSSDFARELSPFLLGPVALYDGLVSRRVENAWQYSKVYPCHVDNHGEPTPEYWTWAKAGWDNPQAVRYPMGKGAQPVYSLWGGLSIYTQQHKLSYVEARKAIYHKIYSETAGKTQAFASLQQKVKEGKDFGLWDFDGYNHHALGMSLRDVLNNPSRKCGHAFHLAIMLSPGYVGVAE